MVLASANPENRIHPLSVEAYHLLYEKGLIDEKAELIEGVIYEKRPKNPKHSEIQRRINKFLYSLTKFEYVISTENPLTLGDSEPEPDIALVSPGDYSSSHPSEALLVIEVANTSLAFDRKKSRVYAQAGIPEYLIFNLVDSKIELYRQPKEGIYTEIKILSEEEEFKSFAVPTLNFRLAQFL